MVRRRFLVVVVVVVGCVGIVPYHTYCIVSCLWIGMVLMYGMGTYQTDRDTIHTY
jgi:hypothetical protein